MFQTDNEMNPLNRLPFFVVNTISDRGLSSLPTLELHSGFEHAVLSSVFNVEIYKEPKSTLDQYTHNIDPTSIRHLLCPKFLQAPESGDVVKRR